MVKGPGRPAADRRDKLAVRLLDIAATEIDAFLSGEVPGETPFPKVLSHLDVGAILAKAGYSSDSRTITVRWGSVPAFRTDAAVWALAKRDRAEEPLPIRLATALEGLDTDVHPVDATIAAADTLLRELVADPRSYLITHLTPLLAGDADGASAVVESLRAEQRHWTDAYSALIDLTGVPLREGWTPHRVALVLQALTSGFLVHQRVQPDDYEYARTTGYDKSSLFADSILAFIAGVLDLDRDGATPRAILMEKWTVREA